MIFRKKIDSHINIYELPFWKPNNNHFALARYLRDHGLVSRLLLFGDEDEGILVLKQIHMILITKIGLSKQIGTRK